MNIAIVAKIEEIQKVTPAGTMRITFTNGSTLVIIPIDQPAMLIGGDYDRVFLDPLADDHTKLLARAAVAVEGGEVGTL